MRGAERKIDAVVVELLKKYTGGVRFFDAIDAYWRSNRDGWELVDEYFHAVTGLFDNIGFISTGRFGMFLHNRYPDWDFLLVTGGLRSGAPMDRLDYLQGNLKGRPFLLLDDSYYSGTTFSRIAAEVERLGGRLYGAYVIYDGSPVKEERVWSLYRYYDHYSPEPWSDKPNVRKVKK
jgi:hypothetical protein